MKEAWDGVSKLLDELHFILIESGIPQRQISMPLFIGEADPCRIKAETYVEAFDWLHAISLSQEYITVVKVKTLLPQSNWDLYKLQGFRNFQEQILLEKAQLALRKLWKTKRPSFFGKIFHATEPDTDQADASGVCVQSEDTGADAGTG